MTTNPDFNISEFPELDGRRPSGPDRVIMDGFEITPALPEVEDTYFRMPVRLVHTAAGGYGIELGPYDLDAADILVLRRAVAAYYRAIAAPTDATNERGK